VRRTLACLVFLFAALPAAVGATPAGGRGKAAPRRDPVLLVHEVADEVSALKARTGAAHVDVVSHSIDAISTRWFLERLGSAASVDARVSLAGVSVQQSHV
jgi:hypothetical protein